MNSLHFLWKIHWKARRVWCECSRYGWTHIIVKLTMKCQP